MRRLMMRIIDSIDKDYFWKTGVLRLHHLFPVCQVCGKERPQEERQFLSVFGKCQMCVTRREGEKDER